MSVAATRASVRCSLSLALLLAWLAAHAAEPVSFAPRPDLPIDLDAASSEFDRRHEKLVFRSLRITQGPLQITADLGEATRIDFENARWNFSGNVVIENQGARVYCSSAELSFVGHAHIGQPEVSHPAPVAEFIERRDDLAERRHAIPVVDLVQVDVVGAKSSKAVL